ncbi:MAG TPA: hypothetical protein VMH81_40200 [Bryobacteraceae bacterium]|nr:hypothetical protein [Bryobacteraceae bacterium]
MKFRSAAVFLSMALTAFSEQRNLGRIEFPTSGSKEAQVHFIQGVLLLHSFEYDDSREEFQQASKIEPGFAMAYWGEALTYTHPVWVQQDLQGGRAALMRLAPTRDARLAKALTEREKDYLRAVEILYGDGDKIARDIAYAEAMDAVRKKYPDDLEAASLYAVALLGTCQYRRDFAVYMRAAAVAEEVFAKNPEHPGAIHYLIHAYDDPIHAPLGLRLARIYGKVAGSASHAQHMPAHIFFAMGMWDDAISANGKSSSVADDRVKLKGLDPDQRNYHSLLWLEYALLQEGRYAEAHRVLEDLANSALQTRSARALSHLGLARAAYAVETGGPDKLTGQVDLAKGGVEVRTAFETTRGLNLVRSGRADEARKTYADAAKLVVPGHDDAGAGLHANMPMAGASAPAGKAPEIMVQQLQAALLFADGKQEEALRLLAKTTEEEDAMTFEFGPPMPVKPAHELYGEMLLQAGRAREAREQFTRALARAPRRTLSMRGLAKADAESGDTASANRVSADLKTFWRGNQ